MKERVFNLFLFCSDEIIRELGAVCHEASGNDGQKLAFLQSQVNADLPKAKRYPVPDRYVLASPDGKTQPGLLRYQTFQQLAAAGSQAELFEEVFTDLGGPGDPLMCVTPIVDGRPRIETIETFT